MKKIALASLLISAPLFASDIVQNNTNGAYQVEYFSPIGQSFVAEDASIQSIGIYADVFNPGWPYSGLNFTLFNGSGFGGSVVGSALGNESIGVSGWADADFSSVSLVVGQTYTFQVATTNGSPYWGLDVNNGVDAYAGGNMFSQGSAQNGDLRFHVIAGEGAVPEPTSLALMGLGLGALSLVGLRRRRA